MGETINQLISDLQRFRSQEDDIRGAEYIVANKDAIEHYLLAVYRYTNATERMRIFNTHSNELNDAAVDDFWYLEARRLLVAADEFMAGQSIRDWWDRYDECLRALKYAKYVDGGRRDFSLVGRPV